MFAELPNDLLLVIAGAILLGCLLLAMLSRSSPDSSPGKQDPRDGRIRALEAELRVAKSVGEDSRTDLEKLQDELKETTVGLVQRDNVITDQQSKLQRVSTDLEKSVLKTRQLRSELADRATQSAQAEAKIRQVETELSVAQASTDMIATGVLDYTETPKSQDEAESAHAKSCRPVGARKASR
jgi:chromosome segregation ATPase